VPYVPYVPSPPAGAPPIRARLRLPVTTERSLEEVIQERSFLGLLQTHSRPFFRLCNTLASLHAREWSKKHYFQLISEAEELETFLDDYGARYNRNFAPLRELVASVRWFAMAGFSISHLEGRFESYALGTALGSEEVARVSVSMLTARTFIRSSLERLLGKIRQEADRLGLEPTSESFPENHLIGGVPRQLLPRNVGQEDLVDENQRIAEVASKFLAACSMLDELGIRRVGDPEDRRRRLARICTEEQARVYEATVHNLQSAYDTYIKNTVVEGRDERLAHLRGHLSAALHLLEAVTFLTHFVERHESDVRIESLEQNPARLIDRAEVQDVILNHLLYYADRFMQRGRTVAEELLSAYTNLQELVVDLPDDVKLHARPAALIVGIVARYGTPVELEVQGQKCNAGSILELLVTVGSHPDARHFVFRGDENPLRDILLLFQSSLGEGGIDHLPGELQYLRST